MRQNKINSEGRTTQKQKGKAREKYLYMKKETKYLVLKREKKLTENIKYNNIEC